MSKLSVFFRALGTTIRVIVLGELLFIALVTLYSMQTNSHIFRYAGF